jgi:hypothetical protein
MVGLPGKRKPLTIVRSLAVLGACGLVCLPLSGAIAHPTRASRTTLLGGVNIGGLDTPSAQIDREMAAAHALHATVVRTEIGWSDLQPLGENKFDPRALAAADHIVRAAAADGVRVIMFVDRAPCWASSAPAQLLRQCVPGRSNAASAWPPSNPASYAALLGVLAQRYGAQLAALEVWNEPDQANEAYVAGPHKAQRYATLLRAAYPAIKRAAPQLPVLAGSLVGSDGVFLRALYAAGIKGSYDGLAVHYYTLTLGAVRAIHETQLANGDRAPLWLDEFGWSSCWPRQRIQQEQGCVTARIQAANFTDIFRSLSRAPYLAAAVVYKLQDSPGENFGALTVAGAHKPSFRALARALASPRGNPHPVTLRLRRAAGHILASGSGPVGDFVQLEAFRGSLLRYRALFTLDRFNRFSITLPRAIGTRGVRVRVFQYWRGLGGAAQRST